MKKRISVLFLVFLLAVSSFGCARKAEENTEYNEETMNAAADAVISVFTQMTDEHFKALKNMPEVQQAMAPLTLGLFIEREDFLSMADTWQTGIDECGKLKAVNGRTFSVVSDGAELTMDADFENRDADIVFKFNKNMSIKTMAINAHFSMAEILKKAALNTVLGMGTVFAVLIFISFIIYLFKFIPETGKKAETKKEAEVLPEAPAQIAETESLKDSELAAVIAAAVSAYEGAPKNGFIVRSIKRRRPNKRR